MIPSSAEYDIWRELNEEEEFPNVKILRVTTWHSDNKEDYFNPTADLILTACPNAERMQIACDNFDTAGILEHLSTLQNLKHLRVQFCNQEFTDALQNFAQTCTTLTSLAIESVGDTVVAQV